MEGRILVVDDEKNITFVIQAMLEREGFEVVVFNDSARALDEIASSHDYHADYNAIVTDLQMPGAGGMEILEYCQKNYADIPLVIITAYGTVESAVSALKRGAFDYITKPFDQTELLGIVKKAVATHLQRQKEPLVLVHPTERGSSSTSAPETISSIVGASHQMQDIFKIIAKIAPSPSTVLVWGESGTGKELVAYEVHRQSQRKNKPFIKINCAAIPGTLIESELFGYEKGAFTGAVGAKPGRFELAHDGTLFLDEVAEMSLEMQVKLLRVLQEQEFERVGGVNTIHVDVRIIAATNKDLESEVKLGRFREDLYYRLNVVPIRLPALRERREDIEPLVKFFLTEFNTKLKKSITGMTPPTLAALKLYPWPGNIRQLENVLERMVLMSEGSVLYPEDLPEEVVNSLEDKSILRADDGAFPSFKEQVRKQTQAVERGLIEKALEETGRNVTRAAEKLGLSRKGLQLKMKELGLVKR